MNMFDEARSLRTMMNMLGATQKEMAKRLGKSQSYIANKLRLLGLSPECERLVTESKLSERHARAVLRLSGEDERLSALKRAKERGFTVSETEAFVDFLYQGDVPSRIRSGERALAKNTFLENLNNAVEALVSRGISATKTVSYYGSKAYITVCIDES